MNRDRVGVCDVPRRWRVEGLNHRRLGGKGSFIGDPHKIFNRCVAVAGPKTTRCFRPRGRGKRVCLAWSQPTATAGTQP